MSRRTIGLVLVTILALLLSSCGGAAATSAPESDADLRLAAIFPGVITDADYNTLGYIGATAVQRDMGLDMAYSESVAVPDVERVMREYIAEDYNVIFTHGGQYFSQTQTIAAENPESFFIAEFDAPAAEDAPDNFWVIDRNFHIGFYALGVLAGHATETGKIGYLGGLTLPFSYAEVHAIEQALEDEGLSDSVELQTAWVGDFNDPTGARELADAMIADDVDVIIGSLNLGMLGVFEAAKGADQNVLVTAKYSDKSNFAPENYVTSVLYDWAGPLKDIVGRIQAGETGGYYPLGFDTGVSLQEPANVPDEVVERVNEVVAQLQSGEIEVEKNTEPIE